MGHGLALRVAARLGIALRNQLALHVRDCALRFQLLTPRGALRDRDLSQLPLKFNELAIGCLLRRVFGDVVRSLELLLRLEPQQHDRAGALPARMRARRPRCPSCRPGSLPAQAG